jgi:predicted enzyme related to lactoylglutathione lyase
VHINRVFALTAVAIAVIIASAHLIMLPGVPAVAHAAATPPDFAVGPQYDSTHVYVAPENLDRLVGSLLATFGGTTSKQFTLTITPTPSSAIWQAVSTPVGGMSVLGFNTPIPYPFGAERVGYLVTDMDAAIASARGTGADVLVTPFDDPVGRDAILQWPGGVNMQLYWHKIAPSLKPLQTIPENRVYVSADRAAAFLTSFLAFSQGKVISDDAHAPGIEIGRPSDTYRRIRIQSNFGKLTALVSDGHLPFPYGRETTGYEVSNLTETLAKAKAAGVTILVAPYAADQRDAAFVQFPGGYIAEIHSPAAK